MPTFSHEQIRSTVLQVLTLREERPSCLSDKYWSKNRLRQRETDGGLDLGGSGPCGGRRRGRGAARNRHGRVEEAARIQSGLVKAQTTANAETRRLRQHVHLQPQQLVRRRHLVPFHNPYGVARVERFCFLLTTAVAAGYYAAGVVAGYCPADVVARDCAAGAVARDRAADVCASGVEIDEEEAPPLGTPGEAGGAAVDA